MPSRLLFLAAVLGATPLAAEPVRDFAPYLMTDRAAEIALARSAAPQDVSAQARVLVLTSQGFVEAEAGTNGFTCLVLRSFSGDPADPTFWNPKVRAPNCFNPPASRTVLPETLRRAEWILSGVSPAEADARSRRAYASKDFPPPAPGAMAFMLSPQQYLQENAPPHWMPHLMLYFDRSVEAADWGTASATSPVINGSTVNPGAPVLTLLVPVSQWSDGTPFVRGAGH